jgi:hypothetical protein
MDSELWDRKSPFHLLGWHNKVVVKDKQEKPQMAIAFDYHDTYKTRYVLHAWPGRVVLSNDYKIYDD